MPVLVLPPKPNLDHLKHQAKDLLKQHAARLPEAAHKVREFHPRFGRAGDAEIFSAAFRLSDAQLTVAAFAWIRELGSVETACRAADAGGST